MRLKTNPYAVFRRSRTPAGLYARKKWLRQEGDPSYRQDFEETLRQLLTGQSSDGSWDQCLLKTTARLFGLHLTVRDEIEPVRKGIEWMQHRVQGTSQRQSILPEGKPTRNQLAGLPFIQGSRFLLFTAATLFLASVFGHGEDPGILNLYERFQVRGSKGSGRWCGWSSTSNILRAFVVHPRYARSETVALAVRNLGKVQKKSGTWPEPIPFYQTVNALAHLDSKEGDAQLGQAFERLQRTQGHDGTWSRSQPEWHTFLVIHALKNKGEL
ncbi:MAG: hypothetical protein JXL84_16825 [Deltaproteobacteria bacterium]|nr:hypothetical protein [Deltaproteobacteria bacterium]